MDHGENCFPFLTSLFSHKRLRQLGALAEDICLYEILQHTPVSWHAWERRRHMALDLLSHQRCSLSPPWGRAITFFMLEHTGDLGPYFMPLFFFFLMLIKIVFTVVSGVVFFGNVSIWYYTTSKNRTWKKGQLTGEQPRYLKNKN